MSWYNHPGCSCCEGPFNVGNCPSFSSVGSRNEFVYDPNPYSYNETPNYYKQPPQNQYETNSYMFCGNDAHYGYDCPPQELAEYINTPSWNRPAFYNYDDDDEDYTITITPVLSIEEPIDSLIMKDEHLDTILATESDEVIKSSIKDLVPILNQFEDFFDSNDDSTSINDDYFSIDDITYVEASPLDSKLVSLEEVKDDILREKLLNIHLLIAKIESLNDNLTPDCVLKSPSLFPIPVEVNDSFFKKFDTSLSYSDNSLPGFETFSDHTEETSSGSTTTHTDNSLPKIASDFEDPCSWFCPSITRSSHPQLHLGNPIS
nr:hypothetical protein [Tanacetum cinerariifolium]